VGCWPNKIIGREILLFRYRIPVRECVFARVWCGVCMCVFARARVVCVCVFVKLRI